MGGRGMPPPSTSTLKGYAPQGEEHTTEQEHVAVGDVMGIMRYFQRMSEVLIKRPDCDEGR
jgi:hypothetical protein